jgi:tRNA pseudouridine38-40 synthase
VDSSKYILFVAYDGTQYHGFQWQVGLPTIQDELEQAMKKFCGWSSRIMAASRTDTGVHAKGQVVSFWAKSNLSPVTIVKALNHYLPQDIAIKAAYIADGDFNVRRDAISREYHYYILNSDTRSPFSHRFALFMPRMLNIKAMNEACQFIQGEHDFISFTNSLDTKGTVRYVHQAKIAREGDSVVFRMVANSFLPHQVRNTAGLLLQVGLGKMNSRSFRDIMEAKSLGLAGPRAPAHGLCLLKVNYPKALSHLETSVSVVANKEKQSRSDQDQLCEEFR